MLGLKVTRNTKLWVSRWGTLCGVFAMLMFVTGCPLFPPVTPCTEDADCDDGLFCNGAETCEVAVCVAGDPPCATGQTCVEDTDRCFTPCTADAGCDDTDACTTEVCTAGACVYTEVVCDDDDACTDDDCDAATGCVYTEVDCDDADACTDDDCDAATGCVYTDVDCDDADLCTDDSCDVATGCVNAAVVCAEGEVCNPLTGECVAVCTTAADCDDDDLCTTDTCVASVCVNTAVDCNDDVDCTDDSCDATTGDCLNEDNCTVEGETCNLETGLCEAEAACLENADCDDLLFCNGVETCDLTDPAAGVCVDGTRPCDDTDADGVVITCDDGAAESCEEGDTEAVCTACPGVTIDFTLNQDNLTGLTGDDTFMAPRIYSDGAGGLIDSLQTGDKASGLAGTDSLYATLAQGGNPVVQLTGIENLYFTNYAAETINATNITGAALIGWTDSTANLTVNTLANKVDGYISGMATAATTLSLSFQAGGTSPTTGGSDAITLEVANTTTGTFNVTTAANGFETLNVESSGGNANTLTAITQTTGTTMATANFTGDTGLTVNTIPNTVLTIVGTSMTGALTLGTGTTAATYVGFASAANNLTDLDTGTGGDTLIFGTQFNTNDFTSATVDLGTGTDIVEAIFAADFGVSMPFRNVEEFRFNCTAASTVNFTSITGLTTLTNDGDGGATAITLQNVPATSGAFPKLAFRGDNTQAAQTYDTLTYQATGVTGSSDSLTIDVNNRGTALNAGSATTNVHTIGAITAAGFEVVNVDIADGPATFGGITASTMTSFDLDTGTNVPSGGTITLGTVGPSSAVLVTVDCSGVTANLSATFDWLASGASITTSSGNDTITVGTNSTGTTSSVSLGAGNDTFIGDTNTDCADSVNAGAGSDTIQAGDGNDTITTGDGADIVIFDQTTADDREDISDFTAGTGGDVMKFDQSDLSLNGVTETVGTMAVIGAAGTYINILTGVGSGYATDALAETAFNAVSAFGDGIEYVLIYFNTTANQTYIMYDADADTDGGAVLLGKLTNITTQAGNDLLTAVNIDSQG